jgi:uncharacterized membrane protein (UPF0127 family)
MLKSPQRVRQRSVVCAAVLSAVLATSAPHAAAPPDTPMLILGIGNHSCREYLRSAVADWEARPADSNQDWYYSNDYGLYMVWVDGYLTAANSYDHDKRMLGQKTTHLARMQWLDRFCGDHPQSPFLAAVNTLHEASDVPAIGRTAFEPTRPQPELPKNKLVIVNHSGQRHDFNVEVAITPEQQATGLMFRESLPPDGGMLFDFGNPQPSYIWMKNTIIGLDIVFINADGTIRRIAAHAVPRSLDNIDSGGPVRATLELAAGTAQRLDIRVGDKVLAPEFGTAP